MGFFSWDVWSVALESAGISLLIVGPFALAKPLWFRWQERRREQAWRAAERRRQAPLASEAGRLLRELDHWDGHVPREWQRDHSW